MILKFYLFTSSPILLPFDFRHQFSSSIYELLTEVNPEKAKYFHDNQLRINKKPFKPFVYSNLYFEDFNIFENYGFLLNGEGSLYFSTCEEELANGLLKIKSRMLSIGNALIQIKEIKEYKTSSSSTLKTVSPVVITDVDNGKRRFLDPEHPNFLNLMKKNLLKKIIFMNNNQVDISLDDFDISIVSFDKDGSLMKFKDHFIKAYHMDLCITGNKKARDAALNLGLGVKNGLGFGCILPKYKNPN